jgi:signal transduction histidine kinase/ActR/RegA family two-component response regulator
MRLQLRQASAGLRETCRDMLLPWRGLAGFSVATGASELSRQIARQQFRTLMQELPANVLAAGAGVLLWTVALWYISPGPLVVAWAAAALMSILGVAAYHWMFVRANPPDESLHRWEIVTGRMNFVIGIIWGLSGFPVLQLAHPFTPYLAIGMLMVIAGSLSLYSAYRPSISWLTPPAVVLTVLHLVLQGGLLNMTIGIGFLVVGVLMIRQAKMQSTLLSQSMLAAEERVLLLAELEGQRAAAHEANQAKTRFLANVSHDLRQPMHSIALLTGALRQRMNADAGLVAQIGASVQTMDDMLCALLEVSRLDAGTLPLQVAPLSVANLFERIKLQFAVQAHEKGLVLEVRPCAAWVVSDAYQLQRVLANLMSNAIRYTAQGGVTVRCRVRGSVAWLQVWDSGRGVARADRQRIFEEFVQVVSAQRSRAEGLGLGLSIVRRVTQRLGHSVVLRSSLQRGSLFAIGVPLDVAAGTHAAGDKAQLAALLSSQLILLIDDDAVVLKSMRTLLEAFQCHVLIAESVNAALDAVEDSLRTPDIIISDFRLSKSDTGLHAIARVRNLVGEEIPAVLLTAEVDAARAAAHPFGIPVLAKPLQVQALATELARALRSTASL